MEKTSGRSSRKDKIYRAVVNGKDIKCFACKRPEHKGWLAAVIRKQKMRGLLNEIRSIDQSTITIARITGRAGSSTEIALSGVTRVGIFLIGVLLMIVTIIVHAATIVRRKRQRRNLIPEAATAG